MILPLVLAACGGGGSDDAATSTATSPGSGASSLTLTGTAATGTAITGAPVTVKCATGTGSATTAADGSFTVTVSGGTLPCALAVTTSTATLHSLATGSGSTAVANLTPVTELVVASLAGQDPAAFYANFSATAVTPALVSAAEAYVITVLKQAGIDLTALGDLISSTLTARTSTAAGNAYDQALDRLATALTSGGTTLASLTGAVTTASSGSAGAATSTTVSLPPALLLQPAAANCSALRSASYRVIMPGAGSTLNAQFGLMTINASTLAITRADGSTGTLVANGACRFTDTGTGGYSADLVVSQAGVLVGRYTSNGTLFRNLFGFPEQAHTVAELTGTWNVMSLTPVGATHVGVSGTLAFSASGQMNSVVNCENDSTWAVDTCASIPDSVTGLLGPWVVDSAGGGFDVPNAGTGVVNTRSFVYASGSGALMIASISATGFNLMTKPVALALPTAGTSTTSWNLDMNADYSSNAANYATTNVVSTVDASSNSYTRVHGTVGQSFTRLETVTVNKPRSGLFFRPAGSVLASDGVTTSVIREFTLLRLTGTGLSVGLLPELKVFEFSANTP